MLPLIDELKTVLERQLPGVSVTVEGTMLFVAPKDLTSVCRYLKDIEPFRMGYLANLTAVDYLAEPTSGGAGHI